MSAELTRRNGIPDDWIISTAHDRRGASCIRCAAKFPFEQRCYPHYESATSGYFDETDLTADDVLRSELERKR